MQNNEDILKELRDVTKNRQSWKSNIDNVAEKLGEEHSVPVNAKALWLLGEMGLKHPKKIERHVEDIASYMKDENPKLRERSVNAVGRIGRGDEKLIIPHLRMLMKMRHDEWENVRHAFI